MVRTQQKPLTDLAIVSGADIYVEISGQQLQSTTDALQFDISGIIAGGNIDIKYHPLII